MKHILKLILLIYPVILFANEVGYEVEVILFENLSSQYTDSEKWPDSNNNNITINQTNNIDNMIDINSTEYNDPIFEKLPPESSRLYKQLEKLQNDSNYNILAHKIWKQTGLDVDKAFPVRINSENMTSDTANSAQQLLESPSSTGKSSLTGSVTLIMSRYLHVNTDLTYRRLQSSPKNNNSDYTNLGNHYKAYPIMFERRMRSKEIHYIDHPLVGMIVLAVPIKIESEKIEPLETNTNH